MIEELTEIIDYIENTTQPLSEFADFNTYSFTPRQAELIVEALEFHISNG